MRAAIATGFGDIDKNIHVRDEWPKPVLGGSTAAVDVSDPKSKKGSGFMTIRVLACALAPGDVRVLSGKTDYIQLPEGGHPYIPGSDVCGIVMEVQEGETKFRVGERVVSRFDEPKPTGGLAEYRVVKTELSEKAPKTLAPEQACGLPASAMAAKLLAERHMKAGDRVLILGGSGGVGTILCQYVKLRGASYIAATSTATELVESLGADKVIDYRTTNWWEVGEFQQNKFDVVFDLVNGDNWERGGKSGCAIKRKGAYVALMTGVRTEVVVHGKLDVVRWVSSFAGRVLWSRLNPLIPRWVSPEGLELGPGYLSGLFKDIDDGRIRPVLDPASPFPFTEAGVRAAFKLQKSIHAHGKVVVRIAEE